MPHCVNGHKHNYVQVYSKLGKITGAKVGVFLAEESRALCNLEENFNIFRYVATGTY